MPNDNGPFTSLSGVTTDISSLQTSVDEIHNVDLGGLSLTGKPTYHTRLVESDASFRGMLSVAGSGFVFSNFMASIMSSTGAELTLYDNAVSDANKLGHGFLNGPDSKVVTAAPCFFNDGLIIRGHGDGVNAIDVQVSVIHVQPNTTYTFTTSIGRDMNAQNPSVSYNYPIIGKFAYGAANLHNSLFRFDLSSIPNGMPIASATFSLAEGTGTTNVNPPQVWECLRPWVEGEQSWNEYSSGNSWTTGGGTGAGDRSASPIATWSATWPADTYQDVDVTSTVQAWIDGDRTNNGFLCAFNTLGDGQVDYEVNTPWTKPPKLTIIPQT